MDPEYQEKHLEFVSNNNGSSIQDILLAGLPLHLSPLAVGLSSLLPWDPAAAPYRIFEVSTLLFPPLLSLTVLADSPLYVNGGLGLLVLTIFLAIVIRKKSAKDLKRLWDLKLSEDGVLDAITNYRSSMLLVTAICILAVDFPVFPRRFGKTETYGYGLMDLGVGGFVFSAGLTSQEGRGKETSVWRTVKSSLPLLLLGLARLSVVTLSGYHSNITEYGVHWNFFFSLFAVKVLGSIVIPHLPGGGGVWVTSVVVAVVYEGFLCFGLVDWLLSSAPREGLLDSNKEGLCSCLGYLAIYLAGVSWAKEIVHKPFTFTILAGVLHDLCVWSGLMWLSLMYSTTFFLPPSRRLANYTFFTFVVAYNLSILAGYLLIEAIVVVVGEWKVWSTGDGGKKEKKNQRFLLQKKRMHEPTPEVGKVLLHLAKGVRCPLLFKAISYNALPYFLLSNVLTGLVNMLVPTVETEGCPAVLILSLYLSVLAVFSLVLYSRRIKLF